MFSTAAWVAIEADQARDHPLYGFGGWDWTLVLWWLIQMAVAVLLLVWLTNPLSAGQAAFLIALAVAYVLKKPFFPKLLFLYAALEIAITALSFTGVLASGGISPVTLFTILIVVYVSQSARNNVTFNHRVRQDDRFLYRFLD